LVVKVKVHVVSTKHDFVHSLRADGMKRTRQVILSLSHQHISNWPCRILWIHNPWLGRIAAYYLWFHTDVVSCRPINCFVGLWNREIFWSKCL